MGLNASNEFLSNTQDAILFLYEFLLCTLGKTCVSNIIIIQTN